MNDRLDGGVFDPAGDIVLVTATPLIEDDS